MDTQTTWQPVKVWDEFEHLPLTQETGDPMGKVANEARRIHNRMQDSLKANPEDYIAQGEKRTARDIIAFIDQVENGTLYRADDSADISTFPEEIGDIGFRRPSRTIPPWEQNRLSCRLLNIDNY